MEILSKVRRRAYVFQKKSKKGMLPLYQVKGLTRPAAVDLQKEVKPEEVKPKEGVVEEIMDYRLGEVEAPQISLGEVPPPVKASDKQMQEIISKKVQEMMEEIITKLVPEMTQNVVGLTIERIEKMVREVVPDLAERVIQEEIKRLQKGEKE